MGNIVTIDLDNCEEVTQSIMNEYLDLEENKDTNVELLNIVIHQNQCNSFKNFN